MCKVARKVASHRIVLPNGDILSMSVVLLDEEGNVLSHHPLRDEEAGVEWFPGEFRIKQ